MEKDSVVKITACVIVQKEDKVLLIKRKNTGYMDGMYAFLGGHVNEYESLRHAAVREVYEEGLIKVKEEDLEYVCAIRNGKHNGYINYYFKTDKFEGTPIINEPDKEEEMVWVAIDDIPENIIPNDKRAIYNYINKIFLDEYNF